MYGTAIGTAIACNGDKQDIDNIDLLQHRGAGNLMTDMFSYARHTLCTRGTDHTSRKGRLQTRCCLKMDILMLPSHWGYRIFGFSHTFTCFHTFLFISTATTPF